MIHEVLLRGKENAISAKQLGSILGLNDPREVSKLVERERRNGIPICATTNSENPGYYLPENPEEFECYIKSLHRRLASVCKTLTACQHTHDCMTGQQRIGAF